MNYLRITFIIIGACVNRLACLCAQGTSESISSAPVIGAASLGHV